jgi:hypothetical protein
MQQPANHAGRNLIRGLVCPLSVSILAEHAPPEYREGLGWSRDARASRLATSSYMLSPLKSGLQRGGASSAALPPCLLASLAHSAMHYDTHLQ